MRETEERLKWDRKGNRLWSGQGLGGSSPRANGPEARNLTELERRGFESGLCTCFWCQHRLVRLRSHLPDKQGVAETKVSQGQA